MSAFEIKSQVKLPLSTCVEVVLSGIQFRLFRASITMAIIALAVAFLMTILGDSMIGREVGRVVDELIQPRRVSNFWVSRLSRPLGAGEISQTLVAAESGDDRWEEFKVWGGIEEDDLAGLQTLVRREAVWLTFFTDLPESQLRPLVGRVRGREIFVYLVDPEAWEVFLEALPDTGLMLPEEAPEFMGFLRQWQQAREPVASIAAGHGRALKGVQALQGERSIQEFLANFDEAAIEATRSLGFRIRPDQAQALRVWGQRQMDVRQIEQGLQDMNMRRRFAERFGIQDLNRVTPEAFFSRLATRAGADWLVAAADEVELSLALTPAAIREAASNWVEERRLAQLETSVQAGDAADGFMGFSTRILWLIAVSLIVCVVGIANAMLMSVTERFKEIATMKCLGATDGFIMTNFIMESGFQGLSGGLIGGFLGLALGVVRAMLGFGMMALTSLPVLNLLSVFLFSVAAGVALSVLAAIYPALAAARLAPLEAMRVE